MFSRDVHLGGWTYDVEPYTGFTYSTCPEGQWMRTETPRRAGPGFVLPDEHLMRDPTLFTTWPDTGGTPIEVSGFRSLVRPWSGTG